MRLPLTNLLCFILIVTVLSAYSPAQPVTDEQPLVPRRINKAIELFEEGQPVYYRYTKATDGYEEGLRLFCVLCSSYRS